MESLRASTQKALASHTISTVPRRAISFSEQASMSASTCHFCRRFSPVREGEAGECHPTKSQEACRGDPRSGSLTAPGINACSLELLAR